MIAIFPLIGRPDVAKDKINQIGETRFGTNIIRQDDDASLAGLDANQGVGSLAVVADDPNTAENQALAEALRNAGGARVIEQHMHTDHSFSDHWIALQTAIVNWLNSITKSQP